MQKHNISQREQDRRARQSVAKIQHRIPELERRWVSGPTLSNILNISSVTLWRWRRTGGFPTAKRVNGRLYFFRDEVAAWLDSQQDAI